jgi:hypothetical protein
MKALGTLAEAVVAEERQDPRGRRLVVHSDGHLGPHDAAGEQTTTDGPFVRIKGGSRGTTPVLPRLVSCRGERPQSLW